MSKEINQNYLKSIIKYNPKTGIFYWRIKKGPRIKPGKIAGSIDKKGYLIIKIDRKNYKSHRLAWLYMFGYFPENQIDHINRMPNDNRIKNLREVSNSCNVRNTGNQKNNTSGVKGVDWFEAGQKWRSRIFVRGKMRSLGYYKSYHNAVCARLAAEQCLDWSGCDSSSPAFKYVQKQL